MSQIRKIHLGSGNEILPGFINLDSAALPGVDVVHDLRKMPWPFPENAFDDIVVNHVLEHLPDTIAVMEEMWRIAAHGARIKLRVPYWNSEDFITDPTHIKAFNQHTFDFFDPDHERCQKRPYYTKARFKVTRRVYHVRVFGRYYAVESPFFLKLLEAGAHFLCNVIQVMEFELACRKA